MSFIRLEESPDRLALTGAFTLIEMSIVLVIIGLIAGAILAGRSLVDAAYMRAQISQIQQYNQAVNTFKIKYGQLPGDISDPDATRFGFASRGRYAGEGDGNGVIQGTLNDSAGQNTGAIQAGEPALFWSDLGTAHLIDGAFNAALCCPNYPPYTTTITPTSTPLSLGSFFPQAKLGAGSSYVIVWSGGSSIPSVPRPYSGDNNNYFGIANFSSLFAGVLTSSSSLTVAQAYAIDSKIDDGLPLSGNVLDEGVTAWYSYWFGAPGGSAVGPPFTYGLFGSATSCMDNGGVAGTMHYSIAQSNGAGLNCGLSFKFQ